MIESSAALSVEVEVDGMDESELIPELPVPWVFDGYRRIYNEGSPTHMWQARAINPLAAEMAKRRSSGAV